MVFQKIPKLGIVRFVEWPIILESINGSDARGIWTVFVFDRKLTWLRSFLYTEFWEYGLTDTIKSVCPF